MCRDKYGAKLVGAPRISSNAKQCQPMRCDAMRCEPVASLSWRLTRLVDGGTKQKLHPLAASVSAARAWRGQRADVGAHGSAQCIACVGARDGRELAQPAAQLHAFARGPSVWQASSPIEIVASAANARFRPRTAVSVRSQQQRDCCCRRQADTSAQTDRQAVAFAGCARSSRNRRRRFANCSPRAAICELQSPMRTRGRRENQFCQCERKRANEISTTTNFVFFAICKTKTNLGSKTSRSSHVAVERTAPRIPRIPQQDHQETEKYFNRHHHRLA